MPGASSAALLRGARGRRDFHGESQEILEIHVGRRHLRAALAPFSGKVAVLGHGIAAMGAVDGPLGRLETVQQQWAAAEQHLVAAMELNRRIGAAPALARTQLGYAELLLLRGIPGDCGQAHGLLDEASATVDRISMTGLQPALRQVRAL